MKYILWIALLQYIPFNFNETLGNVPMHFEYYHFAATMYLSFSYKKVSLYHMPSKTCKLSLRLSLYNVYIQRPDPSPPKLRLHFVHVPMSPVFLKEFPSWKFQQNISTQNFSSEFQLRISAQNFRLNSWAEIPSRNFQLEISAPKNKLNFSAYVLRAEISSQNFGSELKISARNGISTSRCIEPSCRIVEFGCRI